MWHSNAYDIQLIEEICLAEILICMKVVLLKARKVAVWCINEKNVLPKYHYFDGTREIFVILHNHAVIERRKIKYAYLPS